MCLITITPEILTAKEDITVYKLVSASLSKKYYAPYQYGVYKEGLNESELDKPKRTSINKIAAFDNTDY